MDRNRQRHRAARVVAEIRVRQAQEPFCRRARARQHQQRQRHLHRHHDAVKAPALSVAEDASSPRLGHPSEVRARELNRRPDAEHDRRHHREPCAKQQDRHVHRDYRFGGERIGGNPGDDERQALPRHRDAQRRAGARDGQRLREQLLDDAAPGSPERGAHRDFLLPVGPAHKQQD